MPHRSSLLPPLLLVVVGAAAWGNGLWGPFVFDDAISVVDNESIRTLGGALAAPAGTPVAGRPVVSLSLAINYALGGLDARGYHAVNVVVHLLCALVLYGIARRTIEGIARLAPAAEGLALSAALLWMVHPLQSECVSYVTQRTESIMALFYLLTIYCAIRAHEGRAGWWSAAAIACCALGMASKEVMVTAPLMVVLYDVAYRPAPLRELLRRRGALYAGLASTWIVLAALMAAGPRAGTVGFSHSVGPWQYALNQAVAILHYLRLAVWPTPLVLDYGFPRELALRQAAGALAAVGALVIVTAVTFVRRPALGFCGAWFFVILAPTSTIVPIATEVAAERRMYLPLAGLAMLAVVGAWAALETTRRRRPGAPRLLQPAVLAIVTVPLVMATRAQNDLYRRPVALWQVAVAERPDNHRARTNLGVALAAAGRVEEGILELRTAVELQPDSARANYNLANALASRGLLDEAVVHYRAALAAEPRAAEAHHNLGVALATLGDPDGATRSFRAALEIRPDDADTHYNLGKALILVGQPAEALGHLQRSMALDPKRPAVLRDTAWLLASRPDMVPDAPREAIRLAARAVELTRRPDPSCLAALAVAYAAGGRFEEAQATAEAAIATARDAGDEALAAEIASRLERYERNRPFRARGSSFNDDP